MVARSKPKGKSPPGKSPPGKSPQGKKSPQGPPAGNKPLNTSKGQFTFTMVTDGCYIEHKWGQNSGHVGVPLEAIPGFVQRLQFLYAKATGQKSPAAKSPKAPGGPKGAIDKKKDAKMKVVKVDKKKKDPPPPKKTVEDLDAELLSYTAQRGAEGEADAA